METEGVYKCTRDSDSRVVPFDHLALKLQHSIKKGVDGCKIFLDKAGSLKCLHAHSSTWIVFNTFLLRIPDYLGVNCFRLQIAFRFT